MNDRLCKFCHQSFTPKSTFQEYCTPEHRLAWVTVYKAEQEAKRFRIEGPFYWPENKEGRYRKIRKYRNRVLDEELTQLRREVGRMTTQVAQYAWLSQEPIRQETIDTFKTIVGWQE